MENWPKNQREQQIAEYWRDKGLKHAEPSPETKRLLKEMDSNFKALCQKVDDIKESIVGENGVIDKLNQQNGRVRKLEIWRGAIFGGLLVVSTIGGYFVHDFRETRDNMLRVEYLEKEITQLRHDFENGEYVFDKVE